MSRNFELSNNKILNYKMLYVYMLYYVSIHLDDRICMLIFEYIILPSITVYQIKKSTLGTKVLQGQGSYYDGNFWYFGF